MQHASKFQLIEITTYLFLSIALDKVTISVLIKLTCNMHLNFRNLNFIPTKNILSKFHNLYIYIYMFTNGLSIESLLHPTFLFFWVATYAYVFVLEWYTCYIDS